MFPSAIYLAQTLMEYFFSRMIQDQFTQTRYFPVCILDFLISICMEVNLPIADRNFGCRSERGIITTEQKSKNGGF